MIRNKYNYRVCIDVALYRKLMAYVMSISQEISGLGRISAIEYPDGVDFIVEELYLLEQQSTLGSTELDQAAVSRFMADLVKQGVDLGTIKLWWHSHGNLNVFWSSTDEENIRGLNNGWLLSLVANRNGDVLLRVDVDRPFPYTIHDLTLTQTSDVDPQMLAEVRLEVAQKVRIIEPPLTQQKWVDMNRLMYTGDTLDDHPNYP